MKRAPELIPLSREHHEALVLARHACDSAEADTVREQVLRRWSQQIEAHFAAEEQVLLPALARAGAGELAAIALHQHAQLRGFVERLRAGDLAALPLWGDAMRRHVQFEERELFALAQELVELPPLARGLARPMETRPT
jgi:hemerythrin-like domain-containing protein